MKDAIIVFEYNHFQVLLDERTPTAPFNKQRDFAQMIQGTLKN